jgi:predicted TIM-barrel fold metal-dependent hydrolase
MNKPNRIDMQVIDAHIHPFVDPAGNFAPYGAPGSLDELINDLKAAGVGMACGSVLVREAVSVFEDIVRLNDHALEIRARYPDFYIPGIHVHGDFPMESCAELERLHAVGVRWIGELVPYIMKTGSFDAPGMMDIYAVAQDLDMPVNVHINSTDDIESAVSNFPKLKIVIAHPGDVGEAKKRFEYIAAHDNVYIDISGTGLFRWNMLRYAIDVCGSEKILFGSDFPICNSAMMLHGVLAEHLTDAERENVLSINFLRLTGMDY